MSRVRIGTGYMFTFAKFSPNRPFSPGANRLTKADCNSLERSTRPVASQTARFFGGKWRTYSGKRSIFARVGFPSALLLPILLLLDLALLSSALAIGATIHATKT